MNTCMPHHDDFAFGTTIVAPRRREVLHRGIRVDIGERAFDLLLVLVESRGSVVSKDEIIASVWHDRSSRTIPSKLRFPRFAVRSETIGRQYVR